MQTKIMIDFQEAAEELHADFIQAAYAETQGKLWKMRIHPNTKLIQFLVQIEGRWYPYHPHSSLYTTKWQPVRNK